MMVMTTAAKEVVVARMAMKWIQLYAYISVSSYVCWSIGYRVARLLGCSGFSGWLIFTISINE